MALDRQRPGDERHGRRRTPGSPASTRGDLGERPAAEEPPGRAHRLEHGLQEDLVMLLRVPERRRGVPRDDLGPGVHVGRGQLVADLLGDQAAERDLLLALAPRRCSGLCRSVTITTFEPDSSTYISSASRMSGAKPSVLPV